MNALRSGTVYAARSAPQGRCGCKGPHIHIHGSRKRYGVYSYNRPPLPPGKPAVLIMKEAEWSQNQFGQEVKKNLYPSDTRDWNRAVQPVAKRLAAWATWATNFLWLWWPMVTGDGWGLSFPDICLTVEKRIRKTSTRKTDRPEIEPEPAR